MIDYSDKFITSLVPVFRPKLANGDDTYPLMQAYENVDAPDRSYASISILGIADIGHMETGEIDSKGQKVKQHQYVTIRINTFGKGAVSAANRLRTSLEYNSMTEKLSLLGVAFINSSDVLNITELIQSTLEERATFTMILGTADGHFDGEYDPDKEGLSSQPNYDEDIIPIERVTVDGSYELNGEEVHTVQVNITTEN